MYILVFLILSILIFGFLMLKGEASEPNPSVEHITEESPTGITYFKRKPYVESQYRVIEEQNLKGDLHFHIEKLESDSWVRGRYWNYVSLEQAKTKISQLLESELESYNDQTRKQEQVVFVSDTIPNLSKFRILETQYLNEKIYFDIQIFKNNNWTYFSDKWHTFESAKRRVDSELESEYNKYASSIIVSKKVSYEN